MRAAVMHAFGEPLSVERLPDPEPAGDGAVIELRATGVCRSDWHAWQGHDPVIRLPHVGGHELAGVVVAVGPGVSRVRLGDQVTVPFCCGCGRCAPCRAGHTQICEVDYQPGFTGQGAFAELVAVPVADLNCIALPGALDFADAASLGCRFMTAYAAVTVRGRLEPGEWLAVHGCGGVGLSAIMLATALGAQVVAVDVDERALSLAVDLGAAHVVDARKGDAAAAVREHTGGGAHLSIDAVGSAATAAASMRGLRKRGRHVQVGLLFGADREPPVALADLVSRELQILGVHGMAVAHFPAMLDLVASGAVQPGRLVRRRIALEEAGGALAAMSDGGGEGIAVIDRF